MNVAQLRKLLEKFDDDLEIICLHQIEEIEEKKRKTTFIPLNLTKAIILKTDRDDDDPFGMNMIETLHLISDWTKSIEDYEKIMNELNKK